MTETLNYLAVVAFVSRRVTALCNLWSGVMEWSLGVEPWCGVLEWILEWKEVRFGVLVTLLGHDFMTDRQTVMKWSGCQILERFIRLKLRQSQAIFYDLPKIHSYHTG